MNDDIPTRDELVVEYLDQLPYPPYPVQEEALLAWFTADQGVLVCAPTGTGKTLIAEAALYEALRIGRRAYYTTPLIALSEQKFTELQQAALRWGFREDDIGLVTGSRRVNPEATVLVVVAEILLNRLLHREQFHFEDVHAVVMDEFHNFADPERGIVWELTLGLLPAHVRLLLLSATVGNAFEFTQWLQRSFERRLELVQGFERRVPLSYRWVGDMLLNELIEQIAEGSEVTRRTPALLFCFNRDECWQVADQLKGKSLLADGQQARLAEELAKYDFTQGAGPKLKQILQRGVGVHHAGVLPKYRRVVEDLFQLKLLSVCVCTETLAAGINLPARSVVMPMLLKGPPGEKKIIDASSAHQIFGRAGRPQFDTEGFVYVLAHEDDVKIARWKEKFDQIPEDTKDPGLLRAKKDLKRKQPTRRSTEQYWNEQQFEKLRTAAPLKLTSRGPIPWRLLAFWLQATPEIEPIRRLINKRLFDGGRAVGAQKQLDQMLLTMWAAGYVTLDPPPPTPQETKAAEVAAAVPVAKISETEKMLREALGKQLPPQAVLKVQETVNAPPAYQALRATPTPDLEKLVQLRSVNPLYGVFLVNQLGIADRNERIQALESVLEMPGSVARHCRVPWPEDFPPGPLATTRLDQELLQMGLASVPQLRRLTSEERDERPDDEEPIRVLNLAEKLRLLFNAQYPDVHSLNTQDLWCVGEVLEFGGNFNKYITSRGLQKHEGVIFRHLLRMIMLLNEVRRIHPPEVSLEDWQAELDEMSRVLTDGCRAVDETSTDKLLEQAPSEEL